MLYLLLKHFDPFLNYFLHCMFPAFEQKQVSCPFSWPSLHVSNCTKERVMLKKKMKTSTNKYIFFWHLFYDIKKLIVLLYLSYFYICLIYKCSDIFSACLCQYRYEDSKEQMKKSIWKTIVAYKSKRTKTTKKGDNIFFESLIASRQNFGDCFDPGFSPSWNKLLYRVLRTATIF